MLVAPPDCEFAAWAQETAESPKAMKAIAEDQFGAEKVVYYISGKAGDRARTELKKQGVGLIENVIPSRPFKASK